MTPPFDLKRFGSGNAIQAYFIGLNKKEYKLVSTEQAIWFVGFCGAIIAVKRVIDSTTRTLYSIVLMVGFVPVDHPLHFLENIVVADDLDALNDCIRRFFHDAFVNPHSAAVVTTHLKEFGVTPPEGSNHGLKGFITTQTNTDSKSKN